MKYVTMGLALLLGTGTAFAQFPPQIKNVIVIVQENRSPDNLFHFLTPACPLPANPDPLHACIPKVSRSCYDVSLCGLSNESGEPVPVMLRPLKMDSKHDPTHSHLAFEWMCD